MKKLPVLVYAFSCSFHDMTSLHPHSFHGMIFFSLMVIFHLFMKGLNWKEASRQISQMVEDIDLVEKRDTPASQLSGGQKRKLRYVFQSAGAASG